MDRLFAALIYGDLATVKRSHEAGVDLLNTRYKDGLSPIIYACRDGHIDILNYLLEIGADPDDMEDYGGTCLGAAACFAA